MTGNQRDKNYTNDELNKLSIAKKTPQLLSDEDIKLLENKNIGVGLKAIDTNVDGKTTALHESFILRNRLIRHMKYRDYINKATALYEANSTGRVVVSSADDADWCDRVTSEGQMTGLNRRVQAAQEVNDWVVKNPHWREYVLFDMYPIELGFSAQADKIKELAHANEDTAHAMFEKARYANSPIKPEDEIDSKYSEAYILCMRCSAKKNFLQNKYEYGKKNEQSILSNIKFADEEWIKNSSIAMGYNQENRYQSNANNMFDIKNKAEQSLPQNVAKEWLDTVNTCSQVNENSKRAIADKILSWTETPLEILSYVPAVGSVASLALSGIYAVNGEVDQAALASLGAVPGLKVVGKAGKALSKLTKTELTKIAKAALEQEARAMKNLSDAAKEKWLLRNPKLSQAERQAILQKVADEKALTKEMTEVAAGRKASSNAAVEKPRPSPHGKGDLNCKPCASK